METKQSFIDRLAENHPRTTTIVVWLLFFVVLVLCTNCKGSQPNIVTIIKTDTLHVYHKDTLIDIHIDTIHSIVKQEVRDSIIKQIIIREVVNEAGEVIHSEKETNNEVFHHSDTNSQLIQHTVDSILRAKLDSINHSQYEEKPVVVEVEKKEPWYAKVWNWIVGKFAWAGLIVIVGVILYFVVKHFKPKL